MDAGFEPRVRFHGADVQQQEWRSGLDPEDPECPDIKEEQEELWISQRGEQPPGPEEADAVRLPLARVLVKSEDGEEKPQFSQLRRCQTGDNGEAEPRTGESTPRMKKEADGDDRGGPEPVSSSHPDTLVQPDYGDKASDSPEPETDDSSDWIKPGETRSGGNAIKKPEVPLSDERYDTGEKSVTSDSPEPELGGSDEDWRETRGRPKSDGGGATRPGPGGKRFSCSECAQTFTCKGSLKKHTRIHTGERPFSCSVCHKSFTQQNHLVPHMRTHTGEKPFSCRLCDKSFAQQNHLVQHMRTHTGEKPFPCSVCPKSFTMHNNLVQHMRTHTGERPFPCSVCGKSFTLRRNLAQHARTHTGEKPFSCAVCGKRFKQHNHVSKHMRTHAGERAPSAGLERRATRKRPQSRGLTG